MGAPDARELLARAGADPAVTTPEEFRAIIASEIKKWAVIVKRSGVRAD